MTKVLPPSPAASLLGLTQVPRHEQAPFYTGIGSRETPAEVLALMTRYAQRLSALGWTLRSGGAPGADSAFDAGATVKEIYVPWNGFEGRKTESPGIYLRLAAEAEAIAQRLHPRWEGLSQGAKKLMTRNVYQILGLDLKTPSFFVLCWTKDGCESRSTRSRDTGGTGLAIALADERNIPIFNLKNPDTWWRLKQLLHERGRS